VAISKRGIASGIPNHARGKDGVLASQAAVNRSHMERQVEPARESASSTTPARAGLQVWTMALEVFFGYAKAGEKLTIPEWARNWVD
jgi:hypothetical protein